MAGIHVPLQAVAPGGRSAVGGAPSTTARLADVVRRRRAPARLVSGAARAAARRISRRLEAARTKSIRRAPAAVRASPSLRIPNDRSRDEEANRGVVATGADRHVLPCLHAQRCFGGYLVRPRGVGR